MRIGFKACFGRIMSLLLKLNFSRKLNVVSVYFPCSAKSCDYKVVLFECSSDIEHNVTKSYEMIIAGNTNFECDLRNDKYSELYSLLSFYKINHCDDFITSNNRNPVTYVNDALGHCSFINHMFVSDSVRQDIMLGMIFESGANVSDYMPLVYFFQFGSNFYMSKHISTRVTDFYLLRANAI